MTLEETTNDVSLTLFNSLDMDFRPIEESSISNDKWWPPSCADPLVRGFFFLPKIEHEGGMTVKWSIGANVAIDDPLSKISQLKNNENNDKEAYSHPSLVRAFWEGRITQKPHTRRFWRLKVSSRGISIIITIWF